MQQAAKQWSGRTDGLPWMHRSLISILRVVDVRVVYAVMDVVIVFYMLFAHKAFMASYHYFRRRFHRNRLSAVGQVYLTFRQFGQVVIDRFAVYAGQHFDLQIEGNEIIEQAMQNRCSCLMLFAHVGNSEMAGYFLKPKQPMYALMYGGEKGTIMENRKKMMQQNGITVLTHDEDNDYLYRINQVMQDGGMLTLFADRHFGSDKSIDCNVLDAVATLPAGPFRIANLYKGATVVSAFVMKESYRKYHVYVKALNDDSAKGYAQQYAEHLTDVVRQFPHQWYNMYEFWNE